MKSSVIRSKTSKMAGISCIVYCIICDLADVTCDFR